MIYQPEPPAFLGSRRRSLGSPPANLAELIDFLGKRKDHSITADIIFAGDALHLGQRAQAFLPRG